MTRADPSEGGRRALRASQARDRRQSLADGGEVDQRLPECRDSALLTVVGRPLRLGDSTDADTQQAKMLRPASVLPALAIDVGSGRDGHG